MSDTIYKFSPTAIHWDAVPGSKYGDLETFDLEMTPTFSGRADIYAVPKSEAHPEGYAVCIVRGDNLRWQSTDPGLEAWNEHLLAKIMFTGVDAVVGPKGEESTAGGKQNAVVEFKDEVIPEISIVIPEAVPVEE